MNKLITTFLTFLIAIIHYGQGIKFDKNALEKIDIWESEDLGFSQTLPIRYSLRPFCPKPGDQGNSG